MAGFGLGVLANSNGLVAVSVGVVGAGALTRVVGPRQTELLAIAIGAIASVGAARTRVAHGRDAVHSSITTE